MNRRDFQMDKKLIHKTDLSFQKIIDQQFGINRGIYNTIDHWFFEHGYTNIVQRRSEIIKFLRYISRTLKRSNGKLRIGSGRLVFFLSEYMKKEYNYLN